MCPGSAHLPAALPGRLQLRFHSEAPVGRAQTEALSACRELTSQVLATFVVCHKVHDGKCHVRNVLSSQFHFHTLRSVVEGFLCSPEEATPRSCAHEEVLWFGSRADVSSERTRASLVFSCPRVRRSIARSGGRCSYCDHVQARASTMLHCLLQSSFFGTYNSGDVRVIPPYTQRSLVYSAAVAGVKP